MNKNSLLGGTALRSVAVFGLAMASVQPAFAQETQEQAAENPPEALTSEQEAESGQDASTEQEIVVTGSRIRRPNLESPLPVTSVGGQEFFETGNISVGDTLNDLPALSTTIGQANSTRFLGTSGLNQLDLRGLGTVRTLVLVNGRRHVGSDPLSTGVTPDINTFPTDLIERVDVVTGGNSAIYGSDAIAGVTNFILKQDYEGFMVRGQGGMSRYEDAGAFFLAGLWGTNFADGRGNIAVNAEWARQNDYFGGTRPWFTRDAGFVQVTALSPDGVPDFQFFENLKSTSINNTGLLRITNAAGFSPCGVAPNGTPYVCTYIFQPDGTLVPQTGERVGIGPFGSFIGGNGEFFSGGKQAQFSPNLERWNINAIGHFDVSEAFVPFFEAKYTKGYVYGTGTRGPFFTTTGTLFGDPRGNIRLDNPYLTAQARAVIEAARTAAGFTSTDATTILVRESLENLGTRYEEIDRKTYRIVGGVRGSFNDDWNYELSLNYGQMKEKNLVGGNMNLQRYLLANDAVRDPVTGNIVCRSTIDPTAADPHPAASTGDPARDAAILAADVAACVPVNVIGGQFTDAQRDYLLTDSFAHGKTSQFDVLGFVSGDTSQFLNLWGGPIGFALGAEYRADDVSYTQDELVKGGFTHYNAIPDFRAPKAKVKEAFGEIRLPIIADRPFFDELTLTAAARVSDYSVGNTGTVWAWNVNGEWSPVRDIRFRAGKARSVRAPNQIELFSEAGQNFAPNFIDPCDNDQIGGNPNRAANCAATGVPPGFDFTYSSSLAFFSGGNPNLEAEESDSITIGGVLTPRFLPGFSLSADYYNIKVNNVISFVAAQQIVNTCVDLPSSNNPFCALFQRAGPGGGPNGEQPGRIIENSLLSGPVNFAKLTARGIDAELAYRGRIGNIGMLDSRLTYTHVFERNNYLDPVDPDTADQQLKELGDPEDAFNWNNSLKVGRFTFGYQMRYLSKMAIREIDELIEVSDNEGTPTNPNLANKNYYPSKFYHDIRFAVDVTDRYNFYLGVDNLTNTTPPLGLNGISGVSGGIASPNSGGSGIYDNKGRFYYGGFVAKF